MTGNLAPASRKTGAILVGFANLQVLSISSEKVVKNLVKLDDGVISVPPYRSWMFSSSSAVNLSTLFFEKS